MKKYSLVLSSILLIILLGSFFSPAFSMYLNRETQRSILANLLTDNDSIISESFPDTAKIEKTTTIQSLNALGVEAEISVTRFDITINGTDFVKAKISCRPADEPYPIIMETPTMQISELDKTAPESAEILTVQNPVRYNWNGITFISTKSTPLYVAHDHPDTGPYDSPTYDIPVDEVSSTVLVANSGTRCIHLPKHIVDDMKESGTIAFALSAAITPILVWLFGLPELVGTKLAALILGLVDVIILCFGLAFTWWVDNVVRTEMGDGWSYMWGFGSWWIFNWCWISFGAWRDAGWFILSPFPSADPVGPKIGYVDNFILVDTPGQSISVGGLGNDTYGCHSNLDSSIYPVCYVADENGNPLQGQRVDFTLSAPDGQNFPFPSVYTDQNGMAQVGFTLDQASAPPGIYLLTAQVNGMNSLEDATAFSYKSCLLMSGYTKDKAKTVIIENTYLVEEGINLTISATTPKCYWFSHWVLNWMFSSSLRTVSLQMNEDYILIAFFVCLDIFGSDGKVDMRDIFVAAMAFGSYPGYARWNPVADINSDGKVDMRDILPIAIAFGQIM